MKAIFNYLQRVWTYSIQRQLMLGIIVVHAVLMTIFVFDLVDRERNFLHQQSIQQAKSLASTLAVNSSSWVLANDVIGLEETLESLKEYPALRYAMVLSPGGRVLGHTDVSKVGLFINDSKLNSSDKKQIVFVDDEASIDIAAPIISNDSLIGWARVNLSQKDITNNLQVITRNGLLYTVLAIVVGALFAYFMAKGITQGLKHIVDVAEKIIHGDESIRADINRHDEIGMLADDINIMLDALEKSQRDLQGIMDYSPTVIYIKDLNSHFTFINREFEKIFHLSREEIIGKSTHDIFPDEIADEMRQNDQDVIAAGHALESEELAPQDDGMHVYTSVKFPLYDENKNIYAICGISTDITERVKILKEKEQLESQLLHTQKMQAIGQLTGGVAHDFNNLLAVMLGYAELSKELYAKDNENLDKYLDQVLIAGTRGRELIQQMMLYSRKDQSDEEIEPMKLDMVAEETVRMLSATLPATIDIKTDIHKDSAYVMANSSLISQVLMNLSINAKDGIENEGSLTISLYNETITEQRCDSCHETVTGKFVVLECKDNGKGIADEVIEHMFEPFYTSKEAGEGTGMGLAVVHGAVHKLGGHIIVDSVIGQGSSFKVLLPATSNRNEEKNSNKESNDLDYDFSALKIMIVDDEPAVAGLLKESLSKCNAAVKVFTESPQAWQYFEQNPDDFDLVITDQTMPDLTGGELSKKILSLRPGMTIILCTGFSAELNEDAALKLGIKYYFDKPVKMAKLFSVIKDL